MDRLDTVSASTFLRFGTKGSSSEYNRYSSIALESLSPVPPLLSHPHQVWSLTQFHSVAFSDNFEFSELLKAGRCLKFKPSNVKNVEVEGKKCSFLLFMRSTDMPFK